MTIFISFLLFLICAFFTLATSNGYANYEGLAADVILTAFLIPSVIALPFCLPKSGRNFSRFLKAYNFALIFIIVLHAKDIPATEKTINTTKSANHAEVVSNAAMNKITIGDFSILIPNTWTVYAPNKTNYILKTVDDKGKVAMYIGYDKSNESQTLEEYALTLESSFKSNLSGDISTSNIADCGIKRIECLYEIFNLSNDNEKTTTVIASFSAPHGHYRVMITTFTPLWEVKSDVFFKTIRSFRLL
ncbi:MULTISPECIES: hypothetical protein [unclassified Modicisalibacter]|uniref:hypothetical protein n=1 Tax=unclassified Modicisalibacter TaxID=2679913 RepID=UPI001CCF5344|nr:MULTISPECIES: hypothetical protein [unclassified Modicisalibacter]MBZ9560090.1 hypothetical protein [Modicisalibacter sp. R2A 31.J]MBZ9575998.1 hypothetical protein [Modicisalibacter sp. MOD 31.J]